MKKLFMLLLGILFMVSISFSLFAEGEKETDVLGAEGTRVVGFSQIDNNNPWRLAETESVKNAAQERGYDLKYSDAQGVQANQIKALRSFIAQGVDGIVLAPQVETGWEPVLREAKAAGIPVVLVDRGVEVTDDSLYVTLIASDFVWEGEQAAKWLAEATGGKARIAELQGTPGASSNTERREGFMNVIENYPDMEIIRSQSADYQRGKGKEVMEAFLKAEGDAIDAVFANNDAMALGAIEAIKEYGLDPGEDILIVSVDAVREAFDAMIDGDLNCTVECTPLLGPPAFDALEAHWNGESLPKWIKSDDQVFTQDMAADLIDSRQY